jgi:predicted nucleotidyltransferase component of viral defense system
MSKPIETIDLAAWVEKAPPDKRNFREAVHIILTAIGTSTALRTKMVMKGGMLMALRYESSRFTKDADFSTKALYVSGDENELLTELDAQLALANAETNYDTMCVIQRSRLMPPGPEKTFPTLSLNIGYAARSNERALQRLLAKQSPNVVEIDHSYNEAVLDVEVLKLTDGDQLQVYSLVNLMAEKFRSLLQQPSRNRNRRQDVYDLSLLLAEVRDWTQAEKLNLRECLVASAESRDIQAQADSMRNPEIKLMAAKGYEDMHDEVDGPLPSFDEIYQAVQDFYESLPW